MNKYEKVINYFIKKCEDSKKEILEIISDEEASLEDQKEAFNDLQTLNEYEHLIKELFDEKHMEEILKELESK